MLSVKPVRGGATRIDQIRIDVTEDAAGAGLVVVQGELDAYTSPLLRKRLHLMLIAGVQPVVLDLERVEFIDLSGLAVIEEVGLELLQADGSPGLVLRRPSRAVRYLLGFRSGLPGREPWSVDLASTT